ncbi:DUF805 domain-containing protein [Aequorivita sp. Q41]|uniref:DUF805 domain-containing protein n=1 Tax=Aequorivita sp. Q41 TaxID=3153300 RepID=UPI003242E02F
MFKNSFSFNGRIRRTEFGISYILFLVFIYGFIALMEVLNMGGYQLFIILGAAYWFQFSQGAKRCHDLGNNGFYQIIPFYIFVLLFSEGQNRNNKYGPDPKLEELQNAENPLNDNATGFKLPIAKDFETMGSELVSGTLLTALVLAVASYLLDDDDWVYFSIESILIMTGYLTVLLLSFKFKPLPKAPIYFVVHRAIFSIVLHLIISLYEMYSNNISNINYSAIGGDIIYILSFFILTYVPYYFYKTLKKPNSILLEA